MSSWNYLVLDYLASTDSVRAGKNLEYIGPVPSQDADWENPCAMVGLAKSIGISPAANCARN